MKVTVTGAEELADAWDEAVAKADDKLSRVVGQGANNIKRDTQARWRGARYAPTLARAVSYDLDEQGGVIGAEIGPVKEKTPAGPLGWIYEYGTQVTAPQSALRPALEAEAPRFEQAAGDAAEKLLDV